MLFLRYVDDLNTVDELDPNFAPPLMCILEEPRGGMGTDERVNVAMIAITPSTGDVVWDEFEGVWRHDCMLYIYLLKCGTDNHMRIELEVSMTFIAVSSD